jgi:hypothetical protein
MDTNQKKLLVAAGVTTVLISTSFVGLPVDSCDILPLVNSVLAYAGIDSGINLGEACPPDEGLNK